MTTLLGWRVNPTVMLGRNQLIDNEVNTDYCKEHKIDIFRRKSGGGCIYADKGCIQFSYISRAINANEAFAAYMQRMADLLKRTEDWRTVIGSKWYSH